MVSSRAVIPSTIRRRSARRAAHGARTVGDGDAGGAVGAALAVGAGDLAAGERGAARAGDSIIGHAAAGGAGAVGGARLAELREVEGGRGRGGLGDRRRGRGGRGGRGGRPPCGGEEGPG